ncbi:hypothetical protein ACYF6T_24820 [Streptomyces sp. 7R007]
MSSGRTTLRLTVPVGLAALTLVATGALTPASAATYWTFRNDYEGTCLTASGTTDSVWTAACDDSLASRNWYWSSDELTDINGVAFHRLVSKVNGKCLTTDQKTATNVVWTSTCGGSSGQFWRGSDSLTNYDGDLLRSSSNGDAVYASPISVVNQYGIEPERFIWWGAHD